MKKYVMLLSVIWFGTAWSQGFILPHSGSFAPELVEHRLNATLQDQIAEIRTSQTFYNPSNRAMEGIYYFPIPKEAVINQFALYVDGKKLVGELLDSGQARAIYEEIVRRNIDPALLEYADHRFFRLSLFPIPARQQRKIDLAYTQILSNQDGLVRFLYPLHGDLQAGRSGVINPSPAPLVPLHNRIEKTDQSRTCRQTLSVILRSQSAISTIYSPTHKIELNRISDQEAGVSYEGDRRSDEGDFILYYALSGNNLGMNLICHRTNDSQGYFMLLISPKSSWAEGRVMEKDVVFVLDTSGSMSGDKLEQAKSALSYCLKSLQPQDRFALITFSSEVHAWKTQWMKTAAGRKEALAFIHDLEAKGGTNIDEALQTAATFKPQTGRPAGVVFITDGVPTVGVQDVNSILDHVRNKPTRSRIFTFGVGNDVNTFLLDKIAESSRAVADYIAPEENMEEKIGGFFDKVGKPVLTDLELDLAHVEIRDMYPKQLPDLFQNDQLLLVGRYSDAAPAEITLQGLSNDVRHRFSYNGRFAERATNEFLPRLWASRKISWLVDDMRTLGENAEVRKEIEALSKEFGILSPYTAFLAQEDKDQARSLSVLPVSPSTFSGNHAKDMSMSAPSQAVGGVAVSVSKQLREMKEKNVLTSNEQIRYVGDKAFALHNDEWVETRYNNEKMITIKHNSPAFINLLSGFPELGRYLSIGKKLVVGWKGKYLRIAETGESEWSVQKWQEFFK